MLDAENGGGQERGVDGARFADGQSAYGNAAGHLRDGEQGIEPFESFGLHGHS